jgi:hypothetical protein
MRAYYVLIALAVLIFIALISLTNWVWEQREQRHREQMWKERERLLDRRKPVASPREILQRRIRRHRPARRQRGSLRPPKRRLL